MGGSAYGGICVHGAGSSDVKPSPKMSGARSELTNGEFPCLSDGCELVVSAASWVISPHTRRPGEEAGHELVGEGGKDCHSQPGGIQGTIKGVSLGNFNCIKDCQRLWRLASSVPSRWHLGGGGRPLREEEGASSG